MSQRACSSCIYLEHRFFPIAGVSYLSILCRKKKAHQRADFEKKIWKNCQKLTKFGMRLAKCNIYLFYFLQKVKILTPSCHKQPAHTVIWIRFDLLTHKWISCQKFTKAGEGLPLSYSIPPHYHKPCLQPAVQEPGPASITWVGWGPCSSYA